MDEPKQPPVIEVDGGQYPFPQLDTILLAEEEILFDYSECVVRDFIPAHPEATEKEKDAYRKVQTMRLRDPAFKRALANIALRRAHPNMSDEDRHEKSGRVNALEAEIWMLWSEDDPPVESSQQPLESKSNTSEPSRLTDSGSSTKSGSDPAGKTPELTGTTESATSSPASPRIELVS